MKTKWIVLTLVALFISKAKADPFDFYCSGPQARAMGCTGVAISEGYESAFLNPALISAKKKIGLGYLFSSQSIDVSLQGQKLEKIGNPLEDVSLVYAGLSVPLSDLSFIFEKSKVLDNISLGIAAALPPNGRVVRVTTSDTKIPSTILYGNRNTRFSAYVGLSGRIPIENFKIYLGGGVHSLAKLPIYLDANLSPDKDLVKVDGWLELLEGFVGGVAFELDQENYFIRAGGTLRTPIQIEIPAFLSVNVVGERAIYLAASLLEHYTPSYFGGGIGGGIKTSSLKISIGLDTIQYKFSELKLPLLEVTDVEPNQLQGALPHPTLPELQDVLVIKAGAFGDIYDVIGTADIMVGAGVEIFPSPLKSQNGSLFVDSDRMTITGGIGTRFKSPGIVKGEIEFIVSGGVQMLQKKEFTETQTGIEGTLPIVSGTLNLLF